MQKSDMKVLVVQDCARSHYAVARALNAEGCLAALATGWYVPENRLVRRLLPVFGNPGLRMLAAGSRRLPPDKIVAFRRQALFQRLVEALAPRNGNSDWRHIRDRRFAERVARSPLPAHNVVYACAYAALELLEAERERGVFTVLEQTDAGPLHYELLAEEERRWPRYVAGPGVVPQACIDRNMREWDLAGLIVAHSEWTRDALVKTGCDPGKIEVAPLAYESETADAPNAETAPGKRCRRDFLRVLWLGNVNVGKGIQYLVDCAARMAHLPVEFTVVGQIRISRKAIECAPRNIRWVGPVPRSSVSRYYVSSDVFVFPTISDGFGLTQLEAMAHGTPVIATPNCGSVVRDGIDGFIVPARDPTSLTKALLNFIADRSLSRRMGEACMERSKEFSLEKYGSNLLEKVELRMSGRRGESRVARTAVAVPNPASNPAPGPGRIHG